MQKSLFTVCAILVLSVLTFSGVIAWPTDPNEVGLYMTEDGTGETGTFEIGFPGVFVHLVLTRPTDTATGTPFDTIIAFECQLNFNPVGNLFKLEDIYPTNAINVGENHLGLGYLEYIVVFGNDFPVTDESVVLVTIHFVHSIPGVIEVTLGPTNAPNIPGQMAFSSVWGDLRVMHPISGSHDAPVFLFDGEAVAVETESFGSVKALYR